MSFYLVAAIAIALVSPPSAPPGAAPAATASAVQVHVTGTTTADPALIRDAASEIQRFSAAALKCDQLSAVKASVQPAGWQPADANYRIGPAGTRYERWEASLCGRTEVFLVGFWAAAEGGTLFQVGYPFPKEPSGKQPTH